MSKYFAVMAGGALGSVVRFTVAAFVTQLYATAFPLGTFLINVSGSFLIGLLMTFFLSHPGVSVNWRLFFVTGVLGGYTTFSSFEWEAVANFRSGLGLLSLLYVISSVVLGFIGAWLGILLANRVWSH